MALSAFSGRTLRSIVPPPPSLYSPAGAQIRPQHGVAFYLRQGDILKVIDREGGQTANFVCFNANDTREWLASGRTSDATDTLCPVSGGRLYSNRGQPLVDILSDSVGRPYFSLTPSSEQTFASISRHFREKRCFSNLLEAFAPFGIATDAVPATLNLFSSADCELTSGAVSLVKTQIGDYVELRANTDLIVGLCAGATPLADHPRFKPVSYEVR